MKWFMNDEHLTTSPISAPNTRPLEQRLARRPHVLARFVSIADMMDAAIAEGYTADQAEGRAIEQLRQLGQELLGDWAQEKQTHSLEAARTQHPHAIKHIKKK